MKPHRAQLLVLALACLLVPACGGGKKITLEDFQKVQGGMSEPEVVALLGAPTEAKETASPLGNSKMMAWRSGDQTYLVTLLDGKVIMANANGQVTLAAMPTKPPQFVPGGKDKVPPAGEFPQVKDLPKIDPVFPKDPPTVEPKTPAVALDDLGKVVADVKDGTAPKKRAAAQALAKAKVDEARRAEVAAALDKLLSDPDGGVSEAGARALVVWGTKDNVPSLTKALDSNNFGVRQAALAALGQIKDAKAADAVAQRLGSDRQAASAALQAMGPAAEGAVVKSMFHKDPNVQQEAAKLLKGYETKDGVVITEALATFKDTDPARRRAAADWLGKAKEDSERVSEVSKALDPVLLDSDVGVCDAGVRAAAVWGTKDNVPALIKLLNHPNGDIHKAAMKVMGKIKDERAVAPIGDRLGNAFEWPDAFAAIQSMGPVAEKELLKLLEHMDGNVRGNSEKLLKILDTKENTEILLALADVKANDKQRNRGGSERLSKMKPDDKYREQVIKALEAKVKETEFWVHEPVMIALGAWATKDNVPLLIKALDHDSAKMRHIAMDSLAKLKDDRAIEPIAARFVKDRREASAALQEFGPAAEKEVVKLLADKDRGVKIDACKVLKNIGGKNSLAALTVLSRDKDKAVATAAADAYKSAATRK